MDRCMDSYVDKWFNGWTDYRQPTHYDVEQVKVNVNTSRWASEVTTT